jgi:hypothetical protein
MSSRYTLIETVADKTLIYIEQVNGPIGYKTIDPRKATVIEDDLREHEVGLFEENGYLVATLGDQCVLDVLKVVYDDDEY